MCPSPINVSQPHIYVYLPPICGPAPHRASGNRLPGGFRRPCPYPVPAKRSEEEIDSQPSCGAWVYTAALLQHCPTISTRAGQRKGTPRTSASFKNKVLFFTCLKSLKFRVQGYSTETSCCPWPYAGDRAAVMQFMLSVKNFLLQSGKPEDHQRWGSQRITQAKLKWIAPDARMGRWKAGRERQMQQGKKKSKYSTSVAVMHQREFCTSEWMAPEPLSTYGHITLLIWIGLCTC